VPAITIRMEKGRPIEKRARACRCCARTRSGRQANRSFLAYLNSLALVACQKSFGPEGHSFRLQIDPLRATVMLLRDGGELLALVHLGRTTLMSQNRGRGASEPPLVEKGRDGPSTIVQREGSDIEFLEQIRPLLLWAGLWAWFAFSRRLLPHRVVVDPPLQPMHQKSKRGGRHMFVGRPSREHPR